MIDNQDKFDKKTRKLVKEVAKESGVSSEKFKSKMNKEKRRVSEMRKNDSGKYKVIGIDKFDRSDWVHGEYNTSEKALQEARRMTNKAMKDADSSSIATVYYAYDPQGGYLGGDTWNNE